MVITGKQNKYKRSGAVLTSVAASVLMALSASNATAAEDSNNQNVEVIQVSGVRSSLENALMEKRAAPSIVDAISASDIDALPALDFGEALQALPGVQLDRSGEGRTSEISLRGLSGGFVKTTAFGQSFATPDRSYGPTGGSNPFAAFEAGVFDGVNLIKTPTADVQAGGMAGVVDKKLQQALSKKDGKYSISLGGRYEELTGNWDKAIKLSAAKHLIKDKLAVAFKFAGSEQTFRRDLMQFTQYSSIDETANGGRNITETAGAYRSAWDLAPDAEVLAISHGRNVSEYSDGDRVSFTGNIEWKPIEDLKVGAHVLYTERDLGEGTKEDTAFSAGLNPTRGDRHQYHAGLEPDMDTAPFIYDYEDVKDDDGNVIGQKPIYMVSKANFTDGAWQVTNRKTTFLEKSKGVMLYADYVLDTWKFDGVLSHSESENQFLNIGLDFRHMEHHNANVNHTPSGGTKVSMPSVATGINGTLNTGQGNMALMQIMATGWDNYLYRTTDDEGNDAPLNWSATNVASSSTTSMDPANGGRRVGHYVDGRVDNPIREMQAAEFNAKHDLDFGFGTALRMSAVKFGVRHSTEELVNRDQKIGAPGINSDNIDANFFSKNILTEQQTDFFNGHVPGTFGVDDGWLTLDTPYVNSRLQDGMTDLTQVTDTNLYALTFAEPSGYYDRLNNGTKLPQLYANNFDVEQTISAAYLMAEFDGEIGFVDYSGNIGVRHETTDNEFNGLSSTKVGSVYTLNDIQYKTDYSNTLPSVNLSFEFMDDFVFRTSYFKALVRPNLRSQTPTLAITESNSSINVTFPKAELAPYTADNYDLSFEWYNREGSAISIGLFQKVITGLFDKNKPCPSLGEFPLIDEMYGEFQGNDSELPGNCKQVDEFTNPDTGEIVNRDVTVTRNFNNDKEITLKGVEFALQQKLDFLPYPWDGFGGVFNYTYISQKADEGVSEGDSKLYKVSPRSFNVIGYWENDGISVRLAYNWRDAFDIKYPGGSYYGTEDRHTKASGRLDLSASYELAKGLKAHIKAYNLTDEQVYEYFGSDERAIARLDYTGRIVEASINYSF